jgi:hypothetical protein
MDPSHDKRGPDTRAPLPYYSPKYSPNYSSKYSLKHSLKHFSKYPRD